MRPLPRSIRTLPVTPLSRGPVVDMIPVEELAHLGCQSPDDVFRWCADHSALYHEEDPTRFSLDVTAAYALGKGYLRCVFRR